MNAYKKHTTLGHTITRHSPNGIDVIETCETCGAQFLLQLEHEPVSMRHATLEQVEYLYQSNTSRCYTCGALLVECRCD